MQKLRKFTNLFLLLAMVSFTSCEGLIEGLIEDAIPEGEMSVTTFTPEVNENNVIFRGELNSIPPGKEVEFGFMWYRVNEEEPTIHRIMLGKRSEKGEFATSITTLPKNENLVVCAFIIEKEPYETETIGEERDFSWRI